jgi:hypothetical protein
MGSGGGALESDEFAEAGGKSQIARRWLYNPVSND